VPTTHLTSDEGFVQQPDHDLTRLLSAMHISFL
jgi:hypothetical protein